MTLTGVHVSDNPSVASNEYPLGKVTREFKSGVIPPQNLIPSFEHTCRPSIDAGMTCVFSFKPTPADVANGKWQLYIEQLARHIRDNDLAEHVVLVIWHEPEDDARDSYPNGTTKKMSFANGAEFVTYFNTVHAWLKGTCPAIVTSHAALGYAYRPHVGGPHDKSAYVTDPGAWVTHADVNSIDIYSGRSFPITDTLEVSPAFKRWLASRPDNTGWGVSERGWPTDNLPARVKAIRDEFAWLKSLPFAARPVFYVAWGTVGTENDPKLLLDSTARDALNEGFSLLASPDIPTVPTDPPAPDDQVDCPLCHGTGKVHAAVAAVWASIVAVIGGGHA